MMKDFRRLKVWERSHQTALSVYALTRAFPKEELYGITSQMRRSATSIPANIAEACGRAGDGEFHRFLSIAMGSAVELEYFLLLARDSNLIVADAYDTANAQVIELQRMLGSLIRKVEAAQLGN